MHEHHLTHYPHTAVIDWLAECKNHRSPFLKHSRVVHLFRYAKCRFVEERENQRGQKTKTGGPTTLWRQDLYFQILANFLRILLFEKGYRMYADSAVWDRRFEREGDLDWGGLWTDPFVEFLRKNNCSEILDLGCGTGNDVFRLSNAGFHVTGLDYSQQALNVAQSKRIPNSKFMQADMAERLPFPESHFDAVMSNVALHMFDDTTTQHIVKEIKRILRPAGVFIFHVNSTEDRPLRAKRRAVLEELSENRIREEDGQTVHFFSQGELKRLFDDWFSLKLEHIDIPHHRTGESFKRVWRGIAINDEKSEDAC